MKKLLIFLAILLSVSSYAQSVLFLETDLHGPPEEQIDFVIIGDGYTPDQMDLFHSHTMSIETKMSETPIFANNADLINTYVIGLASQESGAGTWGSDTANNALGSVFNYMGITERLVRPLYDSVLVHILDSLEIPEVDQVLVLVNDTRRGGYGDFTGIPGTSHAKMSVASRDEMSEIAIHEMAHSWFGLSDEYVDLTVPDSVANNPVYDGPNVALDSASIEWTIALGLPDVGIYSGAIYRSNRYRPSLNCMMRQTGQPFCSWCNFVMQYRITQIPPVIDPTSIEELPEPELSTNVAEYHLGYNCNILGQKIQSPYDDSVVVIRKKNHLIHANTEHTQQVSAFAKLTKVDYVKTYRDNNGNDVRNLYQVKEFVTESGKVLHTLPVPGCSYSH